MTSRVILLNTRETFMRAINIGVLRSRLVRKFCLVLVVGSTFFNSILHLYAQGLSGTENGEWRYLGGDAGNTRYSPLDQINASCLLYTSDAADE